MILLLDNYDSFTWNLFQYLSELGAEVTVKRNDTLTVGQMIAQPIRGLVVSPGPCTPNESGTSLPLMQHLLAEGTPWPVLGVCLGHQCLGQAAGAVVERAPRPVHGKTSEIRHDGTGLFAGIPSPFTATRYHSLVVRRDSIPAETLEVTAETDDGLVMAMRHRMHPIDGVQFHPESIMTSHGKALLANWLERCGIARRAAAA